MFNAKEMTKEIKTKTHKRNVINLSKEAISFIEKSTKIRLTISFKPIQVDLVEI